MSQPSAAPRATDAPTGPEDLEHIVPELEHRLCQMLGRTPRALCGLRLDQDPDRAPQSPTAPPCPTCEALKRKSTR